MLITLSILIAAALAAAITDVRSRRIPNWLTGGLMAYGVFFHSIRAGWSGCLLSLGGLALGAGLLLLPMLVPFAKRGMGAGDIKFLAAVGSIVGVQAVFVVFALATAMGAILSIAFLRREIRNPKSQIGNPPNGSNWDVRASHFPEAAKATQPVSIPYGVALSVGTLIVAVGSLVVRQ